MAAEELSWMHLPAGEYAIVELFGHTSLIGRIGEAERFGSKMLAIEPLFNGRLLDTIYQGGASIYRLTPVSLKAAWEAQPRKAYQLPEPVRAIVPPYLLIGPDTVETKHQCPLDPDCCEAPGHQGKCSPIPF